MAETIYKELYDFGEFGTIQAIELPDLLDDDSLEIELSAAARS